MMQSSLDVVQIFSSPISKNMEKTMSQNHSSKSRTQIFDLVDESLQLSILSQSDFQLVKGGMGVIVREACTCAVGGGEDYDNPVFVFDGETFTW
jgi:hypothetical protein